MDDEEFVAGPKRVPLFTKQKPISEPFLILIPHEYLMMPINAIYDVQTKVARGSVKWHQKQETLFWRGGASFQWFCDNEGHDCHPCYMPDRENVCVKSKIIF